MIYKINSGGAIRSRTGLDGFAIRNHVNQINNLEERYEFHYPCLSFLAVWVGCGFYLLHHGSIMCNRYVTPEEREIEDLWHVGRANPGRWWDKDVFPRGKGAFIRRARDDLDYSRELVAGQWGLIPWFAKEAKLKYPTNNARSEELQDKASYKLPWARGQRCIIPASAFDEPNWETGKNVWWRFRRADGLPWGLAGLWSIWTDKATGEQHESYTMLTVNADTHPLMSRMHKPDPRLGPDGQDKRSVIAIELQDVDLWLTGTLDQVRPLLRPPAMEVLDAGPA